ncbi:NAD(P)H-dependent oxidoreductase [Caballeronia sp. DA-9]|uniref:NAD(P)H-dependent oxidoreductase n=1 Tax=Caballeronia sp. DA-9 TaxID=3436237 RepID=UPI003F68066B
MPKNVLIVYAHHDSNSFAKAMLDRAVKAFAQQGYDTRVSDLHAMAFKAVADDADFTEPRPKGGPGSGTDYQSRQRAASIDGGYSPDILAELDKLAWADAVIFLFPYYWFHVPAILKGWFDRVFAYGRVYSNDHPEIGAYGRGGLKGKRALIGTTFGAPEPRQGAVPSRHSERFEAIQNGVLAYAGFDVRAPFYAWAVAHVGSERRAQYLDAWERRVLGLFADKPELRAADGPTPQPAVLLGRVRAPGEQVVPYGGDRALAGFAAVERLRAKPGKAEALVQKLKPLVAAASADGGTRIYALLRARDDADEIWLIQTFDDAATGKQHADTAPFATILDEIAPLLAEPAYIVPLIPLLAKGL